MIELATLTEQTIANITKVSKTSEDTTRIDSREERLRKAIEEDVRAVKQGLVARLKMERGIRTRERTFDSFDESKQPKAYRICKKYVSKYKSGDGLLLIGGYGTGKTHLASAITNELLDMGVPALYDTWGGHLQAIKDEYTNDERRRLALMKKVDLLVIDDLGKDKVSEWNSEILFEVINNRYEHRRPVVITTNMSLGELDKRCPAVFSRLCEMCEPVIMTGEDYRKRK